MQVEPTTGVAGPAAFLARVDDELSSALSSERERLRTSAPEAVTLVEEIGRIVDAGGKRLRPLFCYWGYRAGGGGDVGAIARAGAALELLHTFALIHDDVVDRSHFRRGEQTTARRFAESSAASPAASLLEGTEPSGDDAFGGSVALLAGDLAQAMADRVLAESGFAAERVLSAFEPFNEMRAQAVAGEFLDLLFARRGRADESDARRVASLKSASYTVVGPLLVGARLAGAGPEARSVLAAYGWPLGEAFQLRDDVLGTFGQPGVTGKDRDTDIREGKQTMLVAKARRLADADSLGVLTGGLGRRELGAIEIERVREVLRGSGALAEMTAMIDALAAEAVAALAAAAFDPEVVDGLEGLAGLVVLRDA